MFSFGYKILLCSIVTIWMFFSQSTEGAMKTCPLPDIPFSSYIAQPANYNRTYNTGDAVTLACKKGFEKQPGSVPVRVCINGRWKKFGFKCKEKPDRRCVRLLRGLLKNVPRNTMIDINIRHSIAIYQCRYGFELVGEKFRMCKKGRWMEKEEPKCIDESDELWVNGTDVCDNKIEKRRKRRAVNLNDNGGLDLVFVLDSSDSVKKDGFQHSLEFAKELVRTIGTSKRADGTRIALVTFSTEVKVEFNLGDAKVDTLVKAIEAIGSVTYVGGATASVLAFRKVRKVVVPFARSDSKRVMLFITDGRTNINCSPKKEAKYLRENEGFEIFAIGVGKKVKVRELKAIASADNDDNHVILVRKYGSLRQAIKKAVEFRIDNSICGESQLNLRPRIVGGKISRRGWWPWQIGIYIRKNSGELELYCGGSLISPRWILTTAHCFYFYNRFTRRYRFYDNARLYAIRAGDHNLAKKEKSEQLIIPEQIYVHNRYQDRKFINDIALVKLSQEVRLGKFVRTVCLPEKDEGDLAIPTKYGVSTGWGATKALKPGEVAKKDDQQSTVLKYAAFTIQHDKLCSNKSVIPINSTVSFCAGDGKGGNDTCRGDTGGAFVRRARRGDEYRWVATGILSWGVGCAQKDQYAYYTRVYPFIDWINKTMDENTNPGDGA